MHCSVLDNGKELGTGKGVNTTTEFNEFKVIFFNKKNNKAENKKNST